MHIHACLNQLHEHIHCANVVAHKQIDEKQIDEYHTYVYEAMSKSRQAESKQINKELECLRVVDPHHEALQEYEKAKKAGKKVFALWKERWNAAPMGQAFTVQKSTEHSHAKSDAKFGRCAHVL